MTQALKLGAVVLVGAVLVSGCGYALSGRAISLPAHIRVIGIPQFVNQSRTADLDLLLTDAVRQEFQGRGRFRVVADTTGVDAILSVTIQPILSVPVEFNAARQGSKYMIYLVASAEFTDERDKKSLWQRPSFRATEEWILPNPTTGADPSTLFSADRNALDRLAREFARTLVQGILENF